jgi:TRAP-type mannitol/chloroaromatic compound transport system permease large subunit
MTDIYLAAIPYMACAMLVVLLLILIPQLALFLPGVGR